jgi:hypothetical protein
METNAAKQVREELEAGLAARLQAGRILGPAQIVNVPRRTIGSRPAFDLSFEDRVVLAALALALIEVTAPHAKALKFDLTMDPPEEGSHREFERRPLEDEEVGAVLIGDIAAFYEYVDHRLLTDEIVELTGDLELSEAVNEALSDLVARGFGLPQGPRGSDVLADFYLSQVDRRLSRLGVRAHRHNDEFRIGVRRSPDAQRALARLEEEIRRLGLVLNPAKTRVVTRSRYERQLEATAGVLQQARDAAAADAAEEADEVSFYGFDPDQFFDASWEDLPVEPVEGVFEEAIASTHESFPGATDQVISECLPALAASGSEVPLPHLRSLARKRPWLIRPVSLYLRALADTEHEQAMIRAVSALLRSRLFLHPWVRGWLIDPLVHCQRKLPPALLRELDGIWMDPSMPWFARARCVIVLASEHRLPEQEDVALGFEEANRPARADIVAAVAIQDPDWAEEFLSSVALGDPVLREVPNLIDAHDFREVV